MFCSYFCRICLRTAGAPCSDETKSLKLNMGQTILHDSVDLRTCFYSPEVVSHPVERLLALNLIITTSLMN